MNVYEDKDEYFYCGTIEQFVDWRRTAYKVMKKKIKKNKGKQIEFKNVVFTKEDVEEEKEKNDKVIHIPME